MEWDFESFKQWVQLAAAPIKVKKAIIGLEKSFNYKGLHKFNPLGALPESWLQSLPEIPQAFICKGWQWLQAESETQRGVWLWNNIDYPYRLKEIYNPPWMLFWEGAQQLVNSPQIAIVGSRKATPTALYYAERFAIELGRAGFMITSGLALGVDNKAHWAAIESHQPTCAVLGCGPDMAYPARAKHLMKKIQKQGLIVSEYLPGTSARAEHFPARNRLISGLSLGVLVVSAAQKSGTLLTAKYAQEQGRDIFVLPYSLGDPSGIGSNWLIQQGAKLTTCLDDILNEFPFEQRERYQKQTMLQQELCFNDLEKPEMLANVGFETTSIEQIIAQSQSTVAEVMNELLQLEVEGWIQSVPGGYVRLRRKDDV